MSQDNPCLNCGACCAYFRVSFYWLEADASFFNPVPAEYTEPLPPNRLCMKGTNQKHPLCEALTGQVGMKVACTIYNTRPSPCRDFGVHYVDGRIYGDREEIERCNRARAIWNLPPIILEECLEGVAPTQPELSSVHNNLPEN